MHGGPVVAMGIFSEDSRIVIGIFMTRVEIGPYHGN
jgi:hypothetical protein